MHKRMPLLMGLLALSALTHPFARAAPPTGAPASPFGLTCKVQPDGVRFCGGNSTTDRVPSWDRTPLDVDVTLPPTGSGPFPTIVMLHGWGNDKTGFESTDVAGKGYNAGAGTYLPVTYHYNNDFYARKGYAVLTYSARGKGQSCGAGGAPRAQAQTGPCAAGFIRLADTRYEARDTQYLLGLLVDQKIVKPGAIGVTGISYGGGQSLELAYLKDRIACAGETLPGDPCNGKANGALIPWRSPRGIPLAINASHPRWFWSDLLSSLLPNGRFLDFAPNTGAMSRTPLGVEIESFLNGLLATGSTGGYIIPPQAPGSANSPWDLNTYGATFDAGEPYGASAAVIGDEIVTHHQGFGIASSNPAPLLLESGWNDELFPVSQSLRVYNDLRARNKRADVTMLFGDVGHSAGSNKQRVNQNFNDQAAAFFDSRLRRIGTTRAPGSVTAFTTTCPAATPDGGPFYAPSWDAIHPAAVRFGSATAQTIVSPVGGATVSPQFDPVVNSNGCKTVAAESDPGTAVYTIPSQGFTLFGLPTITATIATTGKGGQLDGRLWDISPDGQQLLVSRGGYRLLDDQNGRVTFQLHGNGYHFAAGHSVKLELTGSDAPYFRASNSPFSIVVSGTSVSLPVLDRRGASKQITTNTFLQR